MELYKLVTALVALNGGEIIGKTRLQKTVYLLDQCGLGSRCHYDYHYYGPFSSEIAEAADDAITLGLLNYHDNPGFHAVPYRVYETVDQQDETIPAVIGELPQSTIKSELAVMNNYSAIELELAATIRYLRCLGSADAIAEVKQLKPAKAAPERLERAEKLLQKLGLEP